MGVGCAPTCQTWLRQVSPPPASQNHINHWSLSRPLRSRLRPDVRDRQHRRLMPPPMRLGYTNCANDVNKIDRFNKCHGWTTQYNKYYATTVLWGSSQGRLSPLTSWSKVPIPFPSPSPSPPFSLPSIPFPSP